MIRISDFKEGYIDGKFIKLNSEPIIDYLSFTVNDMLAISNSDYLYSYIRNTFDSYMNHHSLELFHLLSNLENKVRPVKAYRKLSSYGIIYKNKNDGNKFTYIHKGQHLNSLGHDFFPLLCFFLLKKKQESDPSAIENLFSFNRVDLAFDLYGIDLVDLLSREDSIIFSKKRLKYFFFKKLNKENLKPCAETFYLGKVNSLFSLCIYKRHLKLNISGPITRIEFRLKKKYAQNLFIHIMTELSVYNDSKLDLYHFRCLYNRLVSSLLYEYLESYLSVKVIGSSKSLRLDRHKTWPWFEHLLTSLKSGFDYP